MVVLKKSGGHDGCVMQQLRSYAADDLMCDVTLKADNHSVRAHRIILAANSDYFRAMFTGNWTEKQMNEIVLQDLTATGLKAVIQFCYHGEITVASITDIGEITAAIHHCQVLEAYEMIGQYMCRSLDEDNFHELYELAYLFDIKGILDCAVEKFIIGKNYQGVNPFWKLGGKLFQHFLTTWWPSGFKNYYFGASTLIKFLIQWAQFDFEKREALIVPKVRRHCPCICREPVRDNPNGCIGGMNKACPTLIAQAMGRFDGDVGDLCLVSSYDFLYYEKINDRQDDIRKKHEIMNGILVYHPRKKEWKMVHFLPHKDFVYSGMTVLGNTLYICGTGEDEHTTSCYKYDPTTDDRWIPIKPLQLEHRIFSVVGMGGKIYAIGGGDGGNPAVEVYDPVKDTWSYGVALPNFVDAHRAVVHNGSIYISGGLQGGQQPPCNQLLCLEAGGEVWQEKAPMLQRRFNHHFVAYKDSLFVFGGLSNPSSQEPAIDPLVERYDIATNSWTRVDVFFPDQMRIYGVCAVGDKIHVLFQYAQERTWMMQLAHFDPESNTLKTLHEFKCRLRHSVSTHLLSLIIPDYVLEFFPCVFKSKS